MTTNPINSIREVFNKVAPGYKVTKELAVALHKYERWFVNKNQAHAEFFNGNTLAVQRVVYSPSDESRLIDEIIQIDDVELAKELALIDTFRGKTRQTTVKPINQMLVWLVYRFNESNLPKAVKENAMVDCMLILQYIMYTSALFNFFPKYLPSQELMEAVNEHMNLKYSIKKYKTWGRYFRAMAETIFNDEYIHKAALYEGASDYDIIYTISDNKTRINSIMKNHYDVIGIIEERGNHIRKSKVFVETPDGVEINSLQRELPSFRDYIHTVVGDQAGFIKDDLLKAVFLIMSRKKPDGSWKPQCKESLVIKTLKLISDLHDTDNKIYTLIDDIMIHAFEYLYTEGFGKHSIVPLPEISMKLKGLYQSSLGGNEKLLNNRKVIEALITKNFRGDSVASVKSSRTAVMLYVVLRALTKRSFS